MRCFINTHKKIFVNSVNMPLKQKISVDYGTEPTMELTLLDKCGKPFEIPAGAEFYLAGDTDFNQETPPCFYSTDYSLNENTITFTIETYTAEFLAKIKNPDSSMVVQLGMKVDEKTTVLLQDEILAQPRVYIEGQPAPSVIEKFYTAGEVDNLFNVLNEKVDEVKSEIPSLTGYATENYVNGKVDEVKAEIPSLEGYATETYVDEKIGEIEIPESDVNLSAYVGGVSITGEVENYENKPVLNYEVKNNKPTIKIGNTENVIPAVGAGMNMEQKADDIKVIAAKNLTLQAYKLGNSKNASMNLSDAGRFDLASDVFSYYGNSFQINGAKLNHNSGLCLLNDNGNVPFYVSEPYIYRTDDLGSDGVYFNFSADSKIDWYTCYKNVLNFYDDGNDISFYRPDNSLLIMSDSCITKEIWISPQGTIEVISIPEYVQVIGDMPTSLEPTKEIIYNGSSYNKQLTHVFVVRGINYNGKWIYTINYAYNFISDYNDIFD